jgi:hypothetical protein
MLSIHEDALEVNDSLSCNATRSGHGNVIVGLVLTLMAFAFMVEPWIRVKYLLFLLRHFI